MSPLPNNYTDYTVAWICALPIEAAAAAAILDQTHPATAQPSGDPNVYTLGEISHHNIVIASLPSGVYGTISAATVATQIRSTFPSIRFALMVGIGGGVPSPLHDIRIGDIVVSKPGGGTNGVIQYDFGKTVASGEFQQVQMLNQPPHLLLQVISRMQTEEILRTHESILDVVSNVLKARWEIRTQFLPPTPEEDQLYDATYLHPLLERSCWKCDQRRRINRPFRLSQEPQVHYGPIASGNQVMKDGETRDRLAEKYGILCFEMEAAGLMNQLPCLVIRGICDYADSHKSKRWQGYAALTAAAYTRILLLKTPKSDFSVNSQPRQACFQIPFERNPRFLGRQDEIIKLEAMVFGQNGSRKAAIAGLGGVGKTQIALELAYRVRAKKREYSIFWLTCTSVESVEQGFSEIGRQLRLVDITSSSDVKLRVKAHLSSEEAGSWLLIIDNADDMDMWSLSLPSIKSFFPSSSLGFTLFTTRNLQIATRLVGPNIVTVPAMPQELAVDLLKQSLVPGEFMDDIGCAIKVVHQLQGLPLAILQAASYVNENSISLETYLSLFNDTESIVELLSQDFGDEWRHAGTSNPITRTWLVSFKEIQKANPLAIDVLSLISCFSPWNIPLALLQYGGESRVEQQNALGILKAYSFITEQDHQRSISAHRLVHVAMRNWLRSEYKLGYWTGRAGQRLMQILPGYVQENRPIWRSFLPHALSVLHSEEFQAKIPDRERIAQRVGQYLYGDGRYREAEILFSEVLDQKRNTLKDDDPEILSSMEWVAGSRWKQGKWKEAEDMELRLIDIRSQIRGAEQTEILNSIANLASTYMNLGRYAQAEQLEIVLLDRYESAFGLDHQKTLTSMSNLASTYRHRGKWKEAEDLALRVFTTRHSRFGPDHPSTVRSMINLAATYMDQGRWREAEDLLIQALETSTAVLGDEHPDVLSTMGNLASIYRQQGRWLEAEQLELRVMKEYITSLGLAHPNTLTSMANLASTYRSQERWGEAEKLELQVTKMIESVLGPEHPITLRSLGNLASTYRGQKRWDESQELELRVTTAFQSTVGPEHPDTLTSMHNLACTYRYQGLFQRAEELELKVIELRKRLLGVDHPDTLSSMWNLSRTWKEQGQNDDAIMLLKECVVIQESRLGPSHPDTVASRADLTAWQSA
ncbi:hypothetical protein ZTR_09656 [Talaromyces verruculosus]|nr:hypothetical protein ZTR_09656 [Talaromyces verruculosus]